MRYIKTFEDFSITPVARVVPPAPKLPEDISMAYVEAEQKKKKKEIEDREENRKFLNSKKEDSQQ